MNPDRPCSARRLLSGSLLGAVLAIGALAGCGAAPELDSDAGRQLQSQVLAVTEAAAAGDPAASLGRLDELVLKLDSAAARGGVSFQRHQSIRASVDAVRTDLAAQQAAADAARVAAEQEAARAAAAEAARVAAEQEAAAQADAVAAAAKAGAAAPAVPAPPPAVAPAPAGNGDGKARDKGKGKD